jgi:hypothetical protein
MPMDRQAERGALEIASGHDVGVPFDGSLGAEAASPEVPDDQQHDQHDHDDFDDAH